MTESMSITPTQKDIINQAIAMLTPYDKEESSYGSYYFEVQDEEGYRIDSPIEFGEYCCCDDDECKNAVLEELRTAHKGININACFWSNDGDHDRIDSCYSCFKPLNEQLTWIVYEFEHHKVHSITKKDLTASRTAFDVRCMLEAMPSCDATIGDYEIHQRDAFGNTTPYDKSRSRQEDFIQKIIAYAQLVISVLS